MKDRLLYCEYDSSKKTKKYIILIILMLKKIEITRVDKVFYHSEIFDKLNSCF